MDELLTHPMVRYFVWRSNRSPKIMFAVLLGQQQLFLPFQWVGKNYVWPSEGSANNLIDVPLGRRKFVGQLIIWQDRVPLVPKMDVI
jgi:hypothetical protein